MTSEHGTMKPTNKKKLNKSHLVALKNHPVWRDNFNSSELHLFQKVSWNWEIIELRWKKWTFVEGKLNLTCLFFFWLRFSPQVGFQSTYERTQKNKLWPHLGYSRSIFNGWIEKNFRKNWAKSNCSMNRSVTECLIPPPSHSN